MDHHMCLFVFLHCADAMDEVEEARTPADLPDDTEQVGEPQTIDTVGNSEETGEMISIVCLIPFLN